ncbi:MAG TPA: Gfo/Idh/MocA family oxidoreductase [Candidatus Acidoferrales bacterium]|nr:Gfo/Idh/MocA family oxidoreductase [Candidatus Acidoferrales bacterium]
MAVALRTAVIGAGLIGARRAEQAAASDASALAVVVDSMEARARDLAGRFGGESETDWRAAVERADVDVVVVSTPNAFLSEIAIAALQNGKHVLIEKPMGRDLADAEMLADVARTSSGLLKIGFNHRYHPALSSAHARLRAGEIGAPIAIRTRYGHGGRPGYEKEWRGDPALAGGGELTDQGVHVLDLIHWFAGVPEEAFAYLSTAVWPIAPLEDNAFGLLRFPGGCIATLHTSWTQWKNLFSFEVFGRDGSLAVEGLGGSYGVERLQVARRNPAGGVPDVQTEEFHGPDASWRIEWDDFTAAIVDGTPYWGTPDDGLRVMRALHALYASARDRVPYPIET